LNEALVLLQEGAPMDAIDAAALKFGMPMGPIALNDLVGLDTSYYAGQVLAAAYPDRAVKTIILAALVQAGQLGKKSGAGFRTYTGKSSKSEPNPKFLKIIEAHRTDQRTPREAELTDRLFLPMLLEATRVLEEQIVREPSDVDMGMILGTGFPPFRGGLLRWCDAEGAGKILERLAPYAKLGKRFEPTETLKRHAQTGELFYPLPKLTAPAHP
jgi:3-hydroxyacyl-CoA dehydrogenase/enoyl-CoA hydratase/3-hydroxybutyryl-CoA epimerase/3-hydroxyacyl-CoA dehydrogenase/enoyl-CoA hydratase/3-hydroxybutyryl-CoA epimerase/enoyl-CoA isomerase